MADSLTPILPRDKQILYLFGSRAKGNHQPDDDFDVFIDFEADIATDRDPYCQEGTILNDILTEYTVENGGCLHLWDLFKGNELVPALEWDNSTFLTRWELKSLWKHAKPIHLDELLHRLEERRANG